MSSLVIVDSGSANLSSIFKATQLLSLQPVISDHPGTIEAARAIIFPGVGSFDHAVAMIRKKELIEALLTAIAADKPFLGICLGMQLLFSHSEESMDLTRPAAGLNVIPGLVRRFPRELPVPHVGWNRVNPHLISPLFYRLESGSYFYFTHSYYVHPENKINVLASTDYGSPFTSAVKKNNLYGVQFHPEKSGPAGLRLLSNFGKIIADQS